MTLPNWTRGIHHDGSAMFVSNPLPALDETVTLTLRTPLEAPIKQVFVRAMRDGEFHRVGMEHAHEDAVAHYWQAELTIDQPTVTYRFKIMSDAGVYYYTQAGSSRADSPDVHDFQLLADYAAPTWVTEQVFYQIFPERFHNGDPSNDVQDNQYNREGKPSIKMAWGDEPLTYREGGSMDFFGGDVNGITKKLDYLQDLGITALYLCPIFVAESHHKYDIRDFFNVDPHFGGNEALIELRQETEKRGIKLMLDVTPNHLSFHHPWVQSFEDDHTTETAEYFFFDEETNSFQTWLGVRSLVKLNYSSQKLRDVMYRDEDSVLKHWLKPPYSADAWRLDVANMTANRGAAQLDHEVWREVRQEIKAYDPSVYLLGEYFQDGTPHIQGDELDASMNYQGFNTPMRRWLGGEDMGVSDGEDFGDRLLLSTEALADQWRNFMSVVPYAVTLQQFNQVGSHDITRILSVTKNDADLVKLGTVLLMTFPGVPCLYYGDEIGMIGEGMTFNRRTMIWEEERWDSDLRRYHQQVIDIRKKSPALQKGGFQLLHAEGDLVAFQRHVPEETVIVVGYRGEESLTTATIDVAQSGLVNGTTLVDLLTEAEYAVTHGKLHLSNLAHGEALILMVQ